MNLRFRNKIKSTQAKVEVIELEEFAKNYQKEIASSSILCCNLLARSCCVHRFSSNLAYSVMKVSNASNLFVSTLISAQNESFSSPSYTLIWFVFSRSMSPSQIKQAYSEESFKIFCPQRYSPYLCWFLLYTTPQPCILPSNQPPEQLLWSGFSQIPYPCFLSSLQNPSQRRPSG